MEQRNFALRTPSDYLSGSFSARYDDTNIVDFDILENCLKEEKNGFSLLC